jgi:hypothetical protein
MCTVSTLPAASLTLPSAPPCRGGLLGLLIDLAHHGADFVGRFLGAVRQLAHFASHHGKAASVFAGARRFDRGVQGQQVGARGDFADNLGKAGNGLRDLVLQRNHHGGCGLAS